MKHIIWFFEDARDWCKTRWKRFWQAIAGWWLNKKLSADTSDRSEAQAAVNRVVMETDIAPDCISALVVHGGPAIKITHDNGPPEVCIAATYDRAADHAIRTIRELGLVAGERSQLNRAQRRQFDAERKQQRKRKETHYN